MDESKDGGFVVATNRVYWEVLLGDGSEEDDATGAGEGDELQETGTAGEGFFVRRLTYRRNSGGGVITSLGKTSNDVGDGVGVVATCMTYRDFGWVEVGNGVGDESVQDLAGGADEGDACDVLGAAGSFTDEEDVTGEVAATQDVGGTGAADGTTGTGGPVGFVLEPLGDGGPSGFDVRRLGHGVGSGEVVKMKPVRVERIMTV